MCRCALWEPLFAGAVWGSTHPEGRAHLPLPAAASTPGTPKAEVHPLPGVSRKAHTLPSTWTPSLSGSTRFLYPQALTSLNPLKVKEVLEYYAAINLQNSSKPTAASARKRQGSWSRQGPGQTGGLAQQQLAPCSRQSTGELVRTEAAAAATAAPPVCLHPHALAAVGVAVGQPSPAMRAGP